MSDTPNQLEKTLAFLLLRLWLAFRAIVAGLEKFAAQKSVKQPLLDEFGNPDISGAMVEMKVKAYALGDYHGLPAALQTAFAKEPLLPGWALHLYGMALGPVLLITGFLLLLGVASRTVLFLTGLLYISLTFGLMLIGQNDGVAWLGLHVLITAAALCLVRYNKFALFNKF